MAKIKAGRDNAKVKVRGDVDISDIAVVTINPDGSVIIKVSRDGRITPGTDVIRVKLSNGDPLEGKLSLRGELTLPPGTVAVG